jgi:hypothetical protein
MRELINIVIYHEKEIIFTSINITLTFCYTKLEVHYLRRAAKTDAVVKLRLLHCCLPLNLIISDQKS